MRGIITAVALIASGLASPLSAASGLAYTVTIQRSGEMARAQTFEVLALEDRLRVSYVNAPAGEGVLYDAIIRTASGIVALNSRNQTWYPSPATSPFALVSNYLSPGAEKVKVKNVAFTMKEGVASAGERSYSGEIRYDVLWPHGGYSVKIFCEGTFTVITTETIPRRYWLGRILPETGYRDADAKIRAAEAQIEGFPIRLSLKAKRTYAGGAPMVDSMDVQISDIRETSPAESEFIRPAGYRMQEPVIGFPGVVR